MISPKKYSILGMLPILAAALVIFNSCVPDNHGYPKKVFIHAEGGQSTIEGETTATFIHFLNGDTFEDPTERTFDENRNVYIYKYDWLTVECPQFGSNMTFIAPPNESSKQRSITVEPTFVYTQEYGRIKVIQGGN